MKPTAVQSPLVLTLATLLLAACGSETPSTSGGGSDAVSARSYLLGADIPDTIAVLAALAGKEGEEVALVGKLQRKVKGRAIFYLTDQSVLDCTRTSDMDSCKTPWDYCCEEKAMKKGTILVELRDAAGQPAKVESLGVRELDLVAVRGTLAPGEGGRLMLLAKDGWYLRNRPKAKPHWVFPE